MWTKFFMHQAHPFPSVSAPLTVKASSLLRKLGLCVREVIFANEIGVPFSA